MSIYLNHAFSLIKGCLTIFEKAGNDILKSFHVNRNGILSNYDTLVVFLVLDLLVPDMILYVLNCESFLRVSIKNTFDQISTVITNKIRNCVICIENFFVKYICLWVFKWQIATNHGI